MGEGRKGRRGTWLPGGGSILLEFSAFQRKNKNKNKEVDQGVIHPADRHSLVAVTRGSHPLTVLLMVHRANDAIKLFFHLSPTRVQLALNLSVSLKVCKNADFLDR